MYVLRLAFLQLTSRTANSLISLLLFAIGMAMISFLILANKQLEEQVAGNLAGIDLVAGAKGSPLQIILSSVMHIDYPTGNISLAEAERLSRHPQVRQTIPIALGDNFMGHRIVGTTHDYAALYNARLLEGVWYDRALEVTLGYQAAKRTALNIGDTFIGVHGFQTTGHAHHDHEYTVTGIMGRTGTVIDRLILTSVESVWKVHHQDFCDDHDHDHHNHTAHHEDHSHEHVEHHHDDHGHHHDDHNNTDDLDEIRRLVEAGEDISAEEMALFQQAVMGTELVSTTDGPEITAMLIMYQGPGGAIQLPRHINENTNMQAASPAMELNRLFTLLGYGFNTMKALAWTIILISAINVFIHLFNTLRQGLFQMALMRVMGAGKGTIFMLILSQGILLATGGWVLGLILSRLIWLLLPVMQLFQSHVGLGIQASELSLLLYAVISGTLAAFFPALIAYKTDVHYTLRSNGRV